MEFLEEIVVVCDKRFRTNATPGNVAAKRFAPCAKILNFDTVLGRPVERNLDAIHVVQGNAEARAELAQLIFVEFLLLVRDVFAFPRFAEQKKLDRKSTRLNSSHLVISYAVFCLTKNLNSSFS